MKETVLEHIEEGYLDPIIFQQVSSSFSWGPVKIIFDIDIDKPEIRVKVKLAGTKIGSGTLNPKKTTITIGGSVSGFKAEVKLKADFPKQKLTYKIEVCVPLLGCKNKKGTLVSW